MIKNSLDKAEDEMTPVERKKLEMLQLEWEGWRKHAEQQWRDMLAQKEQALRKRLEAEANASQSNCADVSPYGAMSSAARSFYLLVLYRLTTIISDTRNYMCNNNNI